MIRITQNREHSGLRILVEGTLSGDWVEELEKCWLSAKQSSNGEPMNVDLSGVSYIDDKGRALLARMFRGGAALRATGVMTRGIIEEIAAADAAPGRSEG